MSPRIAKTACSLCMFAFSSVLWMSAAEDALPEDKGKNIVLKMCNGACHELKQATDLKMSKLRWSRLIDDMVGRGAIGTDEEIDAVVVYFSRNFGKPVNINTASAKEIEAGLSFTVEASARLVNYRAENGPLKTLDELAKIPGLDAKLLEEQKPNIAF